MHHPNVPELYIDAYTADMDDPDTPEWADVTLDIHINDSDDWELWHLTDAQAEEARSALDHVLRVSKGPSIMDSLWESMLDLYHSLVTGMRGVEPMDDDER